jgi:hypothetical protein
VLGDSPESPALLSHLRLALLAISEMIPDWSLQHWNDNPQRAQAGVVQMLAAAHDNCSTEAAHHQL